MTLVFLLIHNNHLYKYSPLIISAISQRVSQVFYAPLSFEEARGAIFTLFRRAIPVLYILFYTHVTWSQYCLLFLGFIESFTIPFSMNYTVGQNFSGHFHRRSMKPYCIENNIGTKIHGCKLGTSRSLKVIFEAFGAVGIVDPLEQFLGIISIHIRDCLGQQFRLRTLIFSVANSLYNAVFCSKKAYSSSKINRNSLSDPSRP